MYLDHAATTPMLPAARQVWIEESQVTGNPSSLHASGRRRRQVVEEGRERIAGLLNVRPSAVVFTSGGTEADNLAIKGLFWHERQARGSSVVVTSRIEHHAVLDPVEWLERDQGAQVRWLPVDEVGRVPMEALAEALDDAASVALCSVMWANNEVGTVQHVAQFAEVCRHAGVPFHTDAVQALGHLPMDLGALNADAVSLSSHKIGGPVGVGALILDPHTALTPVQHGGGQEREVRSGTLDAAGIAAFATAVEHAVRGQQERARQLRDLRGLLVEGVRREVPSAVVNGDPGMDASHRLPGNVHVSFPGCEGDLLLMLLDAAGIDCSTGSACTAGIPEPSHVLLAMGRDEAQAKSSLRFSLSEATTTQDVERLLHVLPGAVERAQRAGAVSARAG